MTVPEAVKTAQRHLILCDAAGRGNGAGANLWRDAAAAIRRLIQEAEKT